VGFLDNGVRAVLPDASYPSKDSATTIWAYKVLRIIGRIDFTSPPADKPTVKVAVGAVHRAPGEWVSSETLLGSPAWFRKHAPTAFGGPHDVENCAFSLEAPAVGELGVSVYSPGYFTDTKTLPVTGKGGTTVEIAFRLEPCTEAHIHVTGPGGIPIGDAAVQLITVIDDPSAFNAELIFVESAATGNAITAQTSKGHAGMQYYASGTTDSEGVSVITNQFRGSRHVLMVWADGHEPGIERREFRGGVWDDKIELSPFTRTVDAYEFSYKGKKIVDATLYILESVDGFTPSMPGIRADAEGKYSSGRIVPGREYTIVLQGMRGLPGIRQLRGKLRFGGKSVVDLSEFGQ
jgi:hypothetical protein